MTALNARNGEKDRGGAGHPQVDGLLTRAFAALFGVFLGLSLLKFGNPVVVYQYLETPPHDYLEWLINTWPPVWGYWAMAVIAAAGFLTGLRKPGAPKWLVALPLLWLTWEFVAGFFSVNATLTRWTLAHFASCTACFYLGLFVLGRLKNARPFFAGLLAGGAITVLLGFEQHFGGLEQTRKFFFMYAYDPSRVAPEMIRKLLSDRIFSTLFYPDTLAGAVLMLLPVALGVIWSMQTELTLGARWLAMVLVTGPSLACLYWTGSKGGWLLALILAVFACWLIPIKRGARLALVAGVLALGLTGFGVRHFDYMKKGAPSAVARIDFWRAAVKITAEHPFFGTGPGTFAKPYAKYQKPNGELPRMTHNDYLEQASDSGVIGGLLYLGMVGGALLWSFLNGQLRSHPVSLGVWFGALGWAMHSAMEFHLYIPAMAWPAFTFLGWLLAVCAKESTPKPQPANFPISA